jgi:hypothetical protein
MATLSEDIKTQSAWLSKAFASDKIKLDYTVHSLIELDKFFNRHSKEGKAVSGGRLSNNLGGIIFSLGSYVGETIVRTIPGTVWVVNDSDPQGEINVSLRFPDETTIWPMQKVMKRFQNGSDDSLYIYGHTLTKHYTEESFDESYWTIYDENYLPQKPWWKFW